MECGEWGLLCALLGGLLDFLAASSRWDAVKAIAALGGLAFGVWRWWYAAERNMHKRLQEYLAKSDRRLFDAQAYILDAIERPNLGGSARSPIFALAPLRRVLRVKRWQEIGSNRPLENEIRQNLNSAAVELERRIAVSRGLVDNYRRQLAGSHVIHGALSSAIANEAWAAQNRVQHDIHALNSFRSALQIPGYSDSLSVKRLEAHQLRRLGHLQEALLAYEAIEQSANSISDEKERDLVIADAKRWRAALIQSDSLHRYHLGVDNSPASVRAKRLLKRADNPAAAPGAVDIREAYLPFHEWDAIDHGDMLYLNAYVAHKLRFAVLAAQCLSDAKLQYEHVLLTTRGLGRIASRKLWKLRAAAKRGCERVRAAERHGRYDLNWLLPPPTPVDDSQLDQT